MSVRLPTAGEYALAVDKEHRWLPMLAPRVPLWIDGDPAGIDAIGDLTEFAVSLAAFLVALRQVDPTGGPEPGLHNWFRGGPLQVYDSQTAQCLGT
jgi:hypothetical protein